MKSYSKLFSKGRRPIPIVLFRLWVAFPVLSSLLLALLGCSPAQTRAQDLKNFGRCPVEYGYQGSHNFPKDIKARVTAEKLGAIAPDIRSSIMKQLEARVGPGFIGRLNLDYGYLVDFDQADALKPSDKDRIDAYDLVFKFSDKAKGLKAFRFKVVADGTGKLIEDLALPDIAAEPQRAILISCKVALEIGSKNGFPLNRTSIYFVYDWDSGSFTWMLSDNRAVEPDEPLITFGKGTYRHMLIEAHTGKVLKIYKETIVS
jgi:hypothetical protein